MSFAIQRVSFFIADFQVQFAWYVEKAGEEVAWRFQSALGDSLRKLSNRPELGRIRHFRSPKFRSLRSYPWTQLTGLSTSSMFSGTDPWPGLTPGVAEIKAGKLQHVEVVHRDNLVIL